ncbi:hypothetical protein KEM48_002833 [Puccinia striiformis f. sp. tritici PST-130]|nr:hypothetical protein KEM48_002833 [Puccinia striiformis f. sp. tritici PST-130]
MLVQGQYCLQTRLCGVIIKPLRSHTYMSQFPTQSHKNKFIPMNTNHCTVARALDSVPTKSCNSNHTAQAASLQVSQGLEQSEVAQHGCVDQPPYVTMVSILLATMAVFETNWNPKGARPETIHLVVQAIYTGISNDLGSLVIVMFA